MDNSYIHSRSAWEIRIDNALKRLSSTERRVADYLLDHAEEVIALSITEVAEACGASESTIVRFCRHIGYKGFQDIKIAIAQSKVPSLQVMYEGISEKSSIPEVKQQVFMSSISAMQETLEILDDKELERAVDAIYSARNIDIYGMGGSYVIAADAQHKFRKIGVRCEIFCDSHIQVVSASQLRKGDVAMGISYSGGSADVVEALELAKRNGATTICLTHMAKSPILRCSDIALTVAAKEMMFRSDGIVSRMAQLAVIDTLYAAVGLKLGQKALDVLEAGRNATTSKGC